MDELNADQRDVVETRDVPILVLAGPGTGKTHTIVERIASLIQEGEDPDRILAITFTNKAAQEMKSRVLKITGKKPSWIRTIHGACAQILRAHIHKLGYTNAFQIASTEYAVKMLKAVIRAKDLSEVAWNPSDLARKIARIKSSGDPKPAADKIEDPTVADIFTAYQEKMKGQGCIDFDDLVYLTLKICVEDAAALAGIRGEWRHLIIDEFQDCDITQYELISLLGRDKGIVAVGDDDQSIYSFRSSTPEVLRMFDEDFRPKIITLKTSYRLPRVVQEAASALIKNNLNRYEKEIYSAQATTGHLEVRGFGAESEEADFVAARIQRLLTEGIVPEEIGVLARRHAELAMAETALKRLKIPTRKTGERSFYEHREVRDMLAYLTVIALPENSAAFERVLKIEKGIAHRVVDLIEDISERNDVGLYQAAEIAVENHYITEGPQNQIKQLFGRFETLRSKVSGYCISDLMRAAAMEFDTLQHLKTLSRGQTNFEKRILHLKELAQMADRFELQSGPGLINFINEMAIAAIRGGIVKENKEIRLVTLHGAKGLEFRVVFLMGASQGNIPHVKGEVEEERRLMYVGITRAKEQLTITHARYVGNEVRQRSLFIDEMGRPFKGEEAIRG